MSVPVFLAELRERDIHLWVDGERLRCSAPADTLTPELRNQLQDRKAEILEFLRAAENIARQQEAIIPMQPHGARPPVFAVPGHNGDIFAYRELAQNLGADQPFFAMHPPGLDGLGAPLERVEDFAVYFADQIQAFRPEGPYVIAGYCAGGGVALELAQELTRRGATINLLALFGCPYPTSFQLPARLRYWAGRFLLHAKAVARLRSLSEARRYFAERLRLRIKYARAEGTPAGSDAVSLLKFQFEQAHARAVLRYTPRRYAGRVGLFWPSRAWERTDTDDTVRLWRAVTPLGEHYYGPDSVDPDRMLIAPDAAFFAELFRRCTERHAPGRAPSAAPDPEAGAAAVHAARGRA